MAREPFAASPSPNRIGLDTSRFKACPLCGALNARENAACFVCGWAGRFETDPELLEAGLREFVARCPSVLRLLRPASARRRWAARIRSFLRWFRPR